MSGEGAGRSRRTLFLVWDEEKRRTNTRKHDVDFEAVRGAAWSRAHVFEDLRYDYQERRWIALVPIQERIHVVVHTVRGGMLRIISVRKANTREVRLYEQSRNPADT